MRTPVVVAILVSYFEAKVTFPHSIFFDTQDLLDGNTVPFKCPTGCRLFSSTINSNLVIMRSDGAVVASLADISSNRIYSNMSGYELKASDTAYLLTNRGALASPRFILYIVQHSAANQDTVVYFLSFGFVLKIDSEHHRYATVISDTNRFLVRDFTGNFTRDRPSVYATGFDAADCSMCNPVYTARSDANAKATTFYVNGPIATIDFGSSDVHSVTVTNREEPLPAVNFVGSVVYSSSGYVGCPSAQGSNYYSPITAVSADFAKSLSDNNIILDFTADYHINSPVEALNVAVNGEIVNLSGYGRTSKKWKSGSMRFKLNSKKINDRSSSAFAVQIEMSKENDNASVISSGQLIIVIMIFILQIV